MEFGLFDYTWNNIVLVAIFGYLIGTVTWGLLFAKIKGVNLREVGSGNIGGTNVSRALGGKWGLLVIILDATKTIIAATLAYFIWNKNNNFAALAGFMALVGHCYPIWQKFKGGKGAATTLGLGFVLMNPVVYIIGILLVIAVFKITRIVSIISILGGAILVTGTLLPWNNTFLYESPSQAWIYATLAYLILLWKHRSNIKRLIAGKENAL